MITRTLGWLLIGCGLVGIRATAAGTPVLNEIFYHGQNDLDDLEWIEVYNPGEAPAELGGWRIGGGVEFTFPAGTRLAPGGFAVLCRDAHRFREYYEVPVAGEFRKSLSNGGDTVELVDGSGRVVDRVKYDDAAPWPVAADGVGASLERITPTAPGEDPQNWVASPVPDASAPGGHPVPSMQVIRPTSPRASAD